MATGIIVKIISKSQKVFRLLLLLLFLLIFAFVGIKIVTMRKKVDLSKTNKQIEEKQALLDEHESSPGYMKYMAIKDLEEKNQNMYRFERIEKISEIFDDLRNVYESGDGDIQLSDFVISLEELSLKWTVSSLKDLYYTNASWKIKALLDRFESLDFIEKMTIKEYEKVDDWFEFVLHANVIENGGE